MSLDHQIETAISVTEAQRQKARVPRGASVNFAFTKDARVMCRLHGSKTFRGFGTTPAAALDDAMRQVLASAKRKEP